MRTMRFVLASVAAWGLACATACGTAAVGYPEWKTVNAPRALEIGTDQALIEALETAIDKNSLNAYFATRVGRANHFLWLLLREGGDQDGTWIKNVRWDLVERVRRIEPQATLPLVMRLRSTIVGNPRAFGFDNDDVAVLDAFFTNELALIAKACPDCLQIWSGGQDPVLMLNLAAKRGHAETLRSLFDMLGPDVSGRLCRSDAWGRGPMDAVQPDDMATQEVLSSCGARAHSEEETEELARSRREREREAIQREEAETREAQREWAEQKEREAEQRRREQASERRQQNERNAEAMRDSPTGGLDFTGDAVEPGEAPMDNAESAREGKPAPPKEYKNEFCEKNPGHDCCQGGPHKCK